MSTTVKCSECNKTVYPLEKITINDGRNFHKACLKCFTCKSSLRPGQHFVHDTKIYCKPHYAAAQGHAPKQETPRETPQETTPREPEPVHTPTSAPDSTVTQVLYAKLESEHTKKQVDSKKDLADIEAQVQRALSHSRSSSSIKSLNLAAALSPRNSNNGPATPSSANTSSSSLTTTQEAPTLMDEVTALVSPRITSEEEDAFFKEQMDKLEEEEEARKKTKKTHTPRKSEDHQRQKEEKLKALKEKKALRQGQSNDVANVNLSAINSKGDTGSRPAEPASEPTINVAPEEANTNANNDAPAEGKTRDRKGSWALKPTSTTRRGSITSQGPVVVGVRNKSSDEHSQQLEQTKADQSNTNNAAENTEHQVKHESTAVEDPVPTVQKAISLVDKSMVSVEAFFSSLGVEKPHNAASSSTVTGGSEADQFIARVAQIKSTAAHDQPSQTNNTNVQHDTAQHSTNTLNSSEFDDFVNKIEEIKGGSSTKKSNTNNKPRAAAPVTTHSTTNTSATNDSGRDPHHYYWDFLKTTPNPEPASTYKSSHSDPNYYYWEFLSQANNKRRGSWAVKPTGTGRRGSVTSGEFRVQQNHNTQSTQ